MQITKERFEDSEQDMGFLFEFKDNGEGFIVRQYEFEREATFIAYMVEDNGKWQHQKLYDIPYDNLVFIEEIQHLIKHEGLRRLYVRHAYKSKPLPIDTRKIVAYTRDE